MSKNTSPDSLGDRLKVYEGIETEARFKPNTWVYARLDGRSFSKLTKNIKRPFDHDFIDLMRTVACELMVEFKPNTVYFQSDEISLVWYNDYYSPMMFDAKKQKLVSTLAAYASAVFTSNIDMVENLSSDFASFDCRVFELPNETEVSNAFLWRAQDAKKNSISQLASHYFSHKELQGKSGLVRIDMLKTEYNVIWEDQPESVKYGTFLKKKLVDHVGEDGNVYTRSEVFEYTPDFSSGDYTTEERVNLVTSKYIA